MRESLKYLFRTDEDEDCEDDCDEGVCDDVIEAADPDEPAEERQAGRKRNRKAGKCMFCLVPDHLIRQLFVVNNFIFACALQTYWSSGDINWITLASLQYMIRSLN